MQFKLSAGTLAVALALASQSYALPTGPTTTTTTTTTVPAPTPAVPVPIPNPAVKPAVVVPPVAVIPPKPIAVIPGLVSAQKVDVGNTKFTVAITVNEFCPVEHHAPGPRTDVTPIEKAWFTALEGSRFAHVYNGHLGQRNELIDIGKAVVNPHHKEAIFYQSNSDIGRCRKADSKLIRFTYDGADQRFNDHSRALKAAGLLCSSGEGRLIRGGCSAKSPYYAWTQPEGEKILHNANFLKMVGKPTCVADLRDHIRTKLVEYLFDMVDKKKWFIQDPSQFGMAVKMDVGSDGKVKKRSVKWTWRGFDVVEEAKTKQPKYSKDAIKTLVDQKFPDSLCDGTTDANEAAEAAGEEDRVRTVTKPGKLLGKFPGHRTTDGTFFEGLKGDNDVAGHNGIFHKTP